MENTLEGYYHILHFWGRLNKISLVQCACNVCLYVCKVGGECVFELKLDYWCFIYSD